MQTSATSCPSAESLAAFADGRLSAGERAAIERHLADCEDCFEQVAAVLAFQAEEAPESGVTPIGRGWSGAWRTRGWLVAAAAAGALAVGLWRALAPAVEPALPASLGWAAEVGGREALAGAARRAWNEGGAHGFGERLTVPRRAFRLGVHLLDAEVARQADDDTGWRLALERGARLLPPDLARRAQASAAGGSERNLAAWAELAAIARESDPGAFDLGAWIEGCRLTALAGDPSAPLLAGDGFQARLAELESHPEWKREPAIARALAEVAREISTRPETAGSLERLAVACESVLTLL